MKRNYYYTIIALLVSLFIYLFYRSEKTVVNELLMLLVSKENYFELRQFIVGELPLNDFIIYSLPEGLWVFAITITSKNLILKFKGFTCNVTYLPLIFAIGLELFQLFHFTKGRFDFMDILISILFWILANLLLKNKPKFQNVFRPYNQRSIICISSYLIVFLSYVWP